MPQVSLQATWHNGLELQNVQEKLNGDNMCEL